MKFFLVLVVSVFSFGLGYGQVTTIDFETDGSGYTPSATEGSGFTDVFNRTNPNIGGNTTYMWAIEDLNTVSNPSLTLDQIDVTGSTDFTFSIDMIAHHYNDWDAADELLITYTLDGGTVQNLLWVQNAGATYNQAASLDTNFDGDGECGPGTLPALTPGNSGCLVGSTDVTFATFSSSLISLSGNATLDIILQFNGFTAGDEGMYLDNIVITENLGTTSTCAISALTAGTQTTCDPTTNTYTQEVTVTYANEPVSGTLDINGQSFAITTSPQAETLTNLTADGLSVNVTAVFSADNTCTFTSNSLFTAAVNCVPPPTSCSELFISEYGEPSSGSGKYVEIYNPTAGTIDLSNYRLWKITNGGSWPESTFNLSGMLASGNVWVVGYNTTEVTNANQTSTTVCSFSGDDAIGLAYNGGSGSTFTLIDVIGEDGIDPGSGWDVAGVSNGTANKTLKRKTSIQVPNTDWTASAGTNTTDSEWEVITYSQTDLGSHITACVAVCSMDALAANTQTACDPITNTYTQEVTVTYSTAPASGTLDVNGQTFAIGTSPQLVTLIDLIADGAAVNVVANFSANPVCTFTSNGLFTASANCSPICNISGITAGTQTACDPTTNSYTQEVTVAYATPPSSGTLDINGQSFAITTSPQTEILTNLTADGLSVNVTAVFSADNTCMFTSNSLFTATSDCTPTTPCSELFISEYVENGAEKYLEIYNPTTATVDLTNYDVVIYSNANTFPNSAINITGSIVSGGVFVIKSSGSAAWAGTADLSTGSLSFNGNDAVALRNAGTIIDIIGSIGTTSSFGDDRTLTRITTIQVPNDTYTVAEWIDTEPYTVLDIGSHVTACVTVTYDWTGTTNTNWNIASNWSGGIVPTAANTSTIPDVSGLSGNFPLITPYVTLGDITVDASASITVATGIILDGVFTNNGTMTLQDGAYLDDFTNSGASFVGNITVETVAANGVANDQRFISSPISLPIFAEIADDLSGPWGTGAQGVNGVAVTVDDCNTPTLAPTSNYGNLFEYDETLVLLSSQCELDGWVVRSSGSLTNARGYSAYLTNGSTVDFTGTPNTGAIQINTTNTSSGVIAAEGWNLLGNPYPSPIGRDAVITAGASDVQYFVTSGVYQGSYTAYGIGSNIAIGQGFQVHVNTSGNINFDNTMRNTNAATWYENENWFEYKLEVSVQGNSFADKTTLFYNNEASNAYEPMYDVRKRKSSAGHPTLSTVGANKDLTLNGLSVNDLGETVPMNLDAGANGSFTLSFEGLETFPSNTTIYVKDLQEDVVHNIADGNYTFTANTTDNKERFEIIFIPVVSLVTTKVDCDENAGNVELSNTNFTNDRTFEIISNNTIVATNDLVNLNESLTAGTYTLNVNDQYGGTQVYIVVIEAAELIEAAFTVSNNELFVGEMLILNNTTINTNTIDWTIDNSMITNVNHLTYTFEVAGIYDVVMTVSNDECIAAKTETITVVNKTTGIETIEGKDITFYPNPVTEVLYVNSTAEINIEIVDILGKTIVKTSKNTINLETVATGIYIIQIYDVNNKLIGTEKLIKQ